MTVNEGTKLYLGVDGGQSHTEAVIADGNGDILGRGVGGPSNHAEQPGGRERLRNAVTESVGTALKEVRRMDDRLENLISGCGFASAHFGMTGGADFKEEIISKTVRSDILTVGHDAPNALYGALAGSPGVVVIAGTGSIVYADAGDGRTAQVGGLGYLFSDEGSGFWLAAQTVRLAVKEQDGLIPISGVAQLVLDHFEAARLRDVTNGYYNGMISRDCLARLARDANDAAAAGNRPLALEIERGADTLVKGVAVAAERTGLQGNFAVSCVGGMFDGQLMRDAFARSLAANLPGAVLIEPRYGPAVGSLLIAYKQAGISVAGMNIGGKTSK